MIANPELEVPLYSKREVADAGKRLAEKIPASAMADPEILTAFKIAWNWRNSHILPMQRIRAELSRKAKRASPDAVSAARPKRMKSIRAKLGGRSLYDIQDIAGCRAILPTINDVQTTLAAYESNAKHVLKKHYDYIADPRDTGYRSHHLVFQFRGDGDEAAFKRQLVEVQLRTQLQHSWATAVEAVGLVRNEDLKHGVGNSDWLRFFALMASEFADEEGCPIVAGTPVSVADRHSEIRAIDAKIDAVKNLDSFRHIIARTARADTIRGMIFLIQYDPERREVNVKSVPNFKIGSSQMGIAETSEAGMGRRIETVLVEVDAASDLRKAYPNYFLDVGAFVERLQPIIEGKRPTTPGKPTTTRSFILDRWKEWRSSKSKSGRHG